MNSLLQFFENPLVRDAGPLLLLALALLLLVRIGQRAVGRYIKDADTRYRTRKAVSFLGYLIIFVVLLASVSEKLSHLAVLLGGVGAGVAFALQEVIISVAGWVAISFGGFYKVGDRVQLGGIKGDVVDIGVLRTTLAEVGQWVNGDLYNGRMVRVANSFVFKEPVVNYSGDFPFLWDEIEVPVKYGSNLDEAGALMKSALESVCGGYAQEAAEIWEQISGRYRLEKASTSPMVTLRFDQNWITFTLRFTVRYDQRRTVKHEISVLLLKAFEASDTLHVAGATLEVTNLAVHP